MHFWNQYMYIYRSGRWQAPAAAENKKISRASAQREDALGPKGQGQLNDSVVPA